jgi:hypothetical protein
MPIQIRKGELEDIPWILDELKKFALFYNTKKSLFPSEHLAATKIGELIEGHVVFISEADDHPSGFIIGLFTPHLFNPEIKVLLELFWWVSEKYRGSRSGLMLLEAFIEFGEKNADWINFSLEKKSPVRESVLLKRGFHLHELNYMREID